MTSFVSPEDIDDSTPPQWTGVLRGDAPVSGLPSYVLHHCCYLMFFTFFCAFWYLYVTTASGKRFRRQFNPNDWESSILTIRHNVLCLGMSYPCVDKVIANYTGKNVKIFHSAPSVDRSVELVRRNLLNEIDGRDLARVVALEANNDILAYTVSKEEGAYYDRRHLHADFNSRTLVNQIHMRWGKTVRFRQVILDYFWSPSGSWAMKHWQKSFFNVNIPKLVTESMLNFGDLENDSFFVSALEANTTEDFISSTAAVVYLPFSSHCLSQVVSCYDNLSQFYTISFLRKDQLDEHTLWKATNTISPESMIGWLAKTINQEEIYCKLDARQIKHGTGDASVTKEDVLDVFNRIDRSDEVRMIKLTALRKFHPAYSKSDWQLARPILGLNRGGYVGMLGKHPYSQKKAETSSSTSTMSEQLKQWAKPRKMSLSYHQLDKLGVQKKLLRRRSLSHQQLDKLAEPKKMPRKRSLSHHQLDQLAEPKKMPRKRSLSHNQLDKLGTRKKEKSDNAFTHQYPEKYVRFRKDGLSTDSQKESSALTGIALEWDLFLTSFESDYSKRSNSCSGLGQLKIRMESLQEGHKITEEIEYANPVSSEKGIGPDEVLTNKISEINRLKQVSETNKPLLTLEPTKSDKNDPPHTPVAMMKVAKMRCVKPATFFESSTAKSVGKAQEVEQSAYVNRGELLQNDKSTPNMNDVLMGANHNAHPGNSQFFNALSMCAHDFSTVADCFIDALKSMEPPGRFLGKDKTDGTWTCIDYDTAIILVPQFLDHYELNCRCDSGPNNERSCDFFSTVQRLFDAKFKGADKPCQFSQLEDASATECKECFAVGPRYQFLSRNIVVAKRNDSYASLFESSSFKLKSDVHYLAMESDEEVQSSTTHNSESIEVGEKKGGMAKLNATKRRGRKGKHLALLALAEQEEIEKNVDTSNDETEEDGNRNSVSSEGVAKLNVVKKRGRRGKSLALALALAEEQKINKEASAFNHVGTRVDSWVDAIKKSQGSRGTTSPKDSPEMENQLDPSSSSTALDTEPTTSSKEDTNETSVGGPDSSSQSTLFAGDKCAAEEIALQRLTEWLKQSTSSDITTAGTDAIEIALRQVTEDGNISVCKLLAQAFEDEATSLRSLC